MKIEEPVRSRFTDKHVFDITDDEIWSMNVDELREHGHRLIEASKRLQETVLKKNILDEAK